MELETAMLGVLIVLTVLGLLCLGILLGSWPRG